MNKVYKVWDKVNQRWSTNPNRKTSAGTWKRKGFAIQHIKEKRNTSSYELVTVEVVEQEILREDAIQVVNEYDIEQKKKKDKEDEEFKKWEIKSKKEQIERLENELTNLKR
jgi:hypothetical protein